MLIHGMSKWSGRMSKLSGVLEYLALKEPNEVNTLLSICANCSVDLPQRRKPYVNSVLWLVLV